MSPPRAFDFEGAVAIVTGAGCRMKGELGNGSATAVLLARHGARVAVLDRNLEAAAETKRIIEEEGGVAEVVQGDVTVDADCKAAVAKTIEVFGKLDILVNIVGIGGAQGTVDKVDIDEFNHDLHYNVTSMVQMARYAVPEMRKNGSGAIVNMSSVCGLTGGSPSVFYPTAKGAIVQMTRAMAGQHGPDAIRVNCVCPGMAYTPMARSRGITEEMRHERKSLGFLKYEGTAMDIGYAIMFLCSKEARWITGAILPIDGGYTAGRVDHPKMGSMDMGNHK
ncbi:Putative oxidoreductase YhdF [Madurella fahalii]|uniref:Oxidoreductase YhdF n=1 Tax=Madurella fahalii TaxID=1157608 RepID=A0ABQ0GH62_9PEZI